jgi:hypothetical protein
VQTLKKNGEKMSKITEEIITEVENLIKIRGPQKEASPKPTLEEIRKSVMRLMFTARELYANVKVFYDSLLAAQMIERIDITDLIKKHEDEGYISLSETFGKPGPIDEKGMDRFLAIILYNCEAFEYFSSQIYKKIIRLEDNND